jgi:multidrug resistance efflux pump
VSIGLCALVAAAYLVGPTLFVPSTSRAMINARLVNVRAPYPGEVAEVAVKTGDAVTAGQPLLRVEQPHPDQRPLAKLRLEGAALARRVESLTTQHYKLDNQHRELLSSLDAYRKFYADRLEHKLTEARGAHEAAKAKRQVSERQYARQLKLLDAGTGSVEDKQLIEAQLALDRGLEEQSCAIVKQHEAELTALGKGVFLGSRDGSHGLPYQRQRVDELAVMTAEVETELATAREQLEQNARQVKVETDLLAARTSQQVKAPIDGLVFRRLADAGTHIENKAPVMQLVDPQQVFVEAVVGRRDFQAIQAGDPVRIRLDGAWTWFDGRVAHKRGLWSDRAAEGEFAATLPPASKDGDYRVVITMDQPPRKASACNCYLVGTRVEVSFPRSPARCWEDLIGE